MHAGYGLSQVIPHDTIIKQHEGYLGEYKEGRIVVGSTQIMYSETASDGSPCYAPDTPEYDIPILETENIKDESVKELKVVLAAHVSPLNTHGQLADLQACAHGAGFQIQKMVS